MAMSMELLLRLKLSAILLLLFLVLGFFHMRTLAHDHVTPKKDDIQSVIRALRGSGYRLFAASVKMVDIQSLLSSEDSYTFFAPPDEDLFDLLFTCKSSQEYMDAVKYHIVNVKLSYQKLRRLPNGAHLHTLMRNRSLILTNVPLEEDDDEAVILDNVAIYYPDLYYYNRFAVHGLFAPVVASWKDPEAMATASWESEFLGYPLNVFSDPIQNGKAESKTLCSDPIHNVSVILSCGIPIRHPGHHHQ